MVVPRDIEPAIKGVTDQESFLRGLLADSLEWPNPEPIEEVHGPGHGWTPADLRTQSSERHLLDGHARQIHLRHGQP